ncbi:MAG: glucosidase, partial [Bacteroidetes bacterium]
GFFFDILEQADGSSTPIKVRSLVGLLSIVAVMIIDAETLNQLPSFQRSLDWFHRHRRQRLKYPVLQGYQAGQSLLLSLVPKDRLKKLLSTLFDEAEFLSPYGIRSLSKRHQTPYQIKIGGQIYSIQYAPGESPNYLFGGNSNWRGPVWMPVNYLFIQALRTYHAYYGDALSLANPVSQQLPWSMQQWSDEISRRLIALFRQQQGERPINQLHAATYRDPHFRNLILFYEYFHGDNGRGLGASHQTGWTGLVANLIEELKDK